MLNQFSTGDSDWVSPSKEHPMDETKKLAAMPSDWTAFLSRAYCYSYSLDVIYEYIHIVYMYIYIYIYIECTQCLMFNHWLFKTIHHILYIYYFSKP